MSGAHLKCLYEKKIIIISFLLLILFLNCGNIYNIISPKYLGNVNKNKFQKDDILLFSLHIPLHAYTQGIDLDYVLLVVL